MRSIPLAMTWEMLTNGRWNFLIGFLGANLVPFLVFSMLSRLGVDLRDPSLVMIHTTFLLMNAFLFSTVVLIAQGRPARLYSYPISTSSLVANHLFPAMAMVGIEMWLSSFLMNLLFNLQCPLWSPALFTSAAIGLILATAWFTDKSAWMPLAIAVVGGGLGTWYHIRFARPQHPLNQLWIASIPGEITILIAAAIVSFLVGKIGMARNRRGEQLKSFGIIAWIDRRLDFDSSELPKFSSAMDAQGWYEWRLKGWAMPMTSIFGVFAGLVIWVVFVRESRSLVEGFVAGGSLLSAVAMVWAIIAGNMGPMDSAYEMGHFLASRPMTSKDMARTNLKMMAQSTLLAWSIWAGTFALVVGILFATGTAPQPLLLKHSIWSGLWYFPLTLIGCWTVMSVLASFGFTGRPTLCAQLFLSVMTLFIAGVCFHSFVLTRNAQLWFQATVMTVCGLGMLVATAWLFAVAAKAKFIEGRTIRRSFCVWAILAGIFVIAWLRYPSVPWTSCLMMVGLSSLVVAPLAAAPLAIAWNRTR